MTLPIPRSATTFTATSDTSSQQSFTPSCTPSSTPRENPTSNLQGSIEMDETKVSEAVAKEDAKVEEIEGSKGESNKEQKAATTVDYKSKLCKKHSKGHKKSKGKSKKEVSGDAESSSSSSSSSDSDSSSEAGDSDSSSSEDEEAARRRRKKSKKKQKEKKSKRKSKRNVSSSEDSDSSDSRDSEEEIKQKKRARKSKRSRRAAQETDDEEEGDDVEQAQAQLRALEIQRIRREQRKGLKLITHLSSMLADIWAAAVEKKRRIKAKRGKKTSSTKPQYFRADELWDREIHAYKLTETAEAADEDEYGEYSFHVRRRFDWEGKYTDVRLLGGIGTRKNS